MIERFDKDARRAVVVAYESARLLNHDKVETEHVLFGLACNPEAVAARVLARHGLDRDRIGDAIARIRPSPSAEDLDAAALASIGFDLDAVREKVEAAFGPGALDRDLRQRRGRRWFGGDHIPLSRQSKKVLTFSLRESLARSLLDAEPTAIFTSSPGQAIGVIRFLTNAGLRVPEEISVIAYGDFPAAGFTVPAVTTIGLPLLELGAAAVDELVAQLDGASPRDLVIPQEPRLFVRESTGSAPASPPTPPR